MRSDGSPKGRVSSALKHQQQTVWSRGECLVKRMAKSLQLRKHNSAPTMSLALC